MCPLAFATLIRFQRAAKKAKKGGDGEEEGGDSALALMDLPMSFGKKKK